MPGRQFDGSSLKYRYGFNGKEMDIETSSTTTYDYGFRIYSPELGRFLSVDPLNASYPWNSTYAFAENDVVRSVDLDGLERKVVIHWVDKHEDGALKIVKTQVNVDLKDKWFEINPVTKNPTGHVYAITETYYYFFNEGKLLKGKDLMEEVRPDMPKPSSNYDYTDEISMSQKYKDDEAFYDNGGSMFNPANWRKTLQQTNRDVKAPDNAQNVDDISMGMLAFSSIAGAPALVRGMLRSEGVAIGGVNNTTQLPGMVEESFTSVFHKGNLNGGVISSGRTLSTGLERETVDAIRTGQLWEFRIPTLKLKEWENSGLVTRLRDLDRSTGVINEELRFSSQLSEELNKYLVKPQ